MNNFYAALTTFLLCTLAVLPNAWGLTNSDRQEIPTVEMLKNMGIENGRAGFVAVGATMVVETSGANLLFDGASMTCTASGSGQYCETKPYVIPIGLKSKNCAATVYYKNSDANWKMRVLNESAVPISADQTLTLSTNVTSNTVNFACPSSGSLKLRIESTAAAALIAFDKLHLGDASNLPQIGTVDFVGSAYYDTTASCLWERSTASQGAFDSNASCPAPTVEFQKLGTWSTTDANLPQITVQNLPAGIYTALFSGAMHQTSSGDVSLTISDGTNTRGRVGFTNGAAQASTFSLQGTFEYTNSGDHTFALFGHPSAANIVRIHAATTNNRLYFYLYRYPNTSTQVVRADALGQLWTGYHDADCSFSRNNTAYGDPGADATCTFATRNSSNIGTVTSALSGADKLPGIVFTPGTTGVYEVCADVAADQSSAGASWGLRLFDGTNELAETGQETAGSNNTVTSRLCGNVYVSSTSAVTVKIQSKVTAGNIVIDEGAAATRAVGWSITQITYGLPMPALTGLATTSSTASERMDRFAVVTPCASSPCTISSQSGGVSSITRSALGVYAVNFAAGTFSGIPVCAGGALGGNNLATRNCNINPSTSTLASVECWSGVSTAADQAFNFVCQGPR